MTALTQTEKRRVVVTGLGVISPLGNDTEQFWQSVIQGKSGVRRISSFDTSEFDCQIAGEVDGFDLSRFVDKRDARRLDRFIQFGVAASVMAAEDARLKPSEVGPERVGVIIGSGIGGVKTYEEQHEIMLKRGPSRVSPFFIPMMIGNMAAGCVSIILGAKGPNSAIVTACASGGNAIGDAFEVIQRGDADFMIAGGAEAAITAIAFAGFCAMKAMSTRNYEPEKASRPFDADRDGFVMGEGSGIVILEELETALARNAHIYAEIVGYGMSGDAHHFTAPCPDGGGAVRAMSVAIRDAGVAREQVDYINAHGTATSIGDVVETLAVKSLFGEHAYKLAVSSTKSMTGHLLGAAGGVEFIISVLACEKSIAPPTINLETPDPECDLDYVPNKARPMEINYVLSNSFGFGGQNACLLVKRWDHNLPNP